MRIAIASGKGGTGKTTLSVALAVYLSTGGIKVNLYDCDVEEPDVNLFLKADITDHTEVPVLVPAVDNEKCTGCGKCDDICEFSAIVLIKGTPLLFPNMCHSCGGCMLVCPENAIEEIERDIGIIEEGSTGHIRFVGGRLNIGEAMAPPLIKEVKRYSIRSELSIIDSPPGTSCPVIEAVDDCDYIILVTEPTPFGLHDLKLAVGMARAINIPFAVVINRSDAGDSRVVDYCRDEGIDILATIPDSREIAEGYSRGEFVETFIRIYSTELNNIATTMGIVETVPEACNE